MNWRRSSRMARREKLFLACETLAILAWIYLLFQLNPGAVAHQSANNDMVVDYQSALTSINQHIAGHHDILSSGGHGNTTVIEKPESAASVQAAVSQTTAPRRHSAGRRDVFQATGIEANQEETDTFEPAAAHPVSAPRNTSTQPCNLRVSTIIGGQDRPPVAVLVDTLTGQSYFVQTGEKIQGWAITAIDAGSATLQTGEEIRTLTTD